MSSETNHDKRMSDSQRGYIPVICYSRKYVPELAKSNTEELKQVSTVMIRSFQNAESGL